MLNLSWANLFPSYWKVSNLIWKWYAWWSLNIRQIVINLRNRIKVFAFRLKLECGRYLQHFFAPPTTKNWKKSFLNDFFFVMAVFWKQRLDTKDISTFILKSTEDGQLVHTIDSRLESRRDKPSYSSFGGHACIHFTKSRKSGRYGASQKAAD